MGHSDTDTGLEPYRPTDREVLIDQAVADLLGRGLWALVDEIRSGLRSAGARAGWERVAAEVYRRTDGAAFVSGQALKKWHRARVDVDRRNASRTSASTA